MSTTNHFLVELPLSGVESEHCALIVNKGLAKINGIQSHKVEYANNKAIIETKEPESINEAVTVIRELGYDVLMEKKIFPVTGMSCASCAVSVESILRSEKGVVNAVVNFANASVMLEYIPGVAEVSQLKKAVQSIGYDLVTDDAEGAADKVEKMQKERYKILQRRTFLSLLFSLPLAVTGMFFINLPFASYLMWALATPVMYFGQQFYSNAWKQLKNRSANMDTLVALSTGIAYIFSIFNTLYPRFWTSRGLEPHVYFEVAAIVITFILLGKLLEEKAKANTSSAIKKLMGLQPKEVSLLGDDGTEQTVTIVQVKEGDKIRVKPGDKIPVDGTIVSGASFVDESMLSGEPIPSLKTAADQVFAGTINQKGSFVLQALKVGADTLLSQIIKRVQEAQGSKAPIQKRVDKIAGIFVPIVMSIAVFSLIAWTVFGGAHALTQGLLAMVTVLIIACPCALGLATPTAIMVGVGKGAQQGILIKDAESLEEAKKINAMILDKTGTITEGHPKVEGMVWQEGADKEKLSAIFYSAEAQSEHPLGEAVVAYFKNANVQNVPLGSFESITGAGISAEREGKRFYIGSYKMMAEKNIAFPPEVKSKADKWRADSFTVIFFADEKSVLAAVAIGDKIKSTSAEAIAQLQHMGIEVYMLTGDNPKTAAAVAQKVGITHYRAEAMPHEKAEFIKELQLTGKVVAMVGDGINDSEALAQADVSIAMGRGTDIAMDVAKMTLISSDLNHIPKAIYLSKKTTAVIKQNLFWAFIYNLIGIPVAAGLLYPFTGFLLNPMIAGAAMALSSLSVVANSLRLKWAKI